MQRRIIKRSFDWFGMYGGVRQGCSLSCILIILLIYIIAPLIRNSTNMIGITIGKYEREFIQFADDNQCIQANIERVVNLFSNQ